MFVMTYYLFKVVQDQNKKTSGSLKCTGNRVTLGNFLPFLSPSIVSEIQSIARFWYLI